MERHLSELYCKCETKLEITSSKRDCDLRILVAHNNMLQSLAQAFVLQQDGPKLPLKFELESKVMACSEPVEYLSPLLCSDLSSERKLRSYEEDETHPDCPIIQRNTKEYQAKTSAST
jgi:hypothetical protein